MFLTAYTSEEEHQDLQRSPGPDAQRHPSAARSLGFQNPVLLALAERLLKSTATLFVESYRNSFRFVFPLLDARVGSLLAGRRVVGTLQRY